MWLGFRVFEPFSVFTGMVKNNDPEVDTRKNQQGLGSCAALMKALMQMCDFFIPDQGR